MKILVLAGGTSAEREVSLDSGACVTAALRQRGHNVEQLDPRDVDIAALSGDWDVVFPLVHGTGGEDGVLQSDLIKSGLPYVGSSPEASALTFDKIRTNHLLKQHGLAVPDSVVVRSAQSLDEIRELIRPLGEHFVTKPPRQGSSVGITIVDSIEQLQTAVSLAFQYDSECLVERFIPGREITVALIDGRPLPAITIVPAIAWYDYESKYADDRTQYVFEDEATSHSLGKLAMHACAVCGVTGIARVDLRVDENDTPWLLEVNTIPGMTSHSLVPKAAAKIGLSLGELCEAVIRAKIQSDQPS